MTKHRDFDGCYEAPEKGYSENRLSISPTLEARLTALEASVTALCKLVVALERTVETHKDPYCGLCNHHHAYHAPHEWQSEEEVERELQIRRNLMSGGE